LSCIVTFAYLVQVKEQSQLILFPERSLNQTTRKESFRITMRFR
jgi:hypothetical protein